MDLGDFIKAQRLALNISRDDLGAVIGRTGETIEHYELGASYPRYRDIEKLIDALDSEIIFRPRGCKYEVQ